MATYFKNTELAARYNISEATVRNWVRSVKEGKMHLLLTEHGGRTYVANDISNIPIIEGLVKTNRKYRNGLASKTVVPDPTLLGTYSEDQVYDIIRNLELHHEIPRQYGYFGRGATDWDDYTNKQLAVETPSLVRRSIELLDANRSYIDSRLAKYRRINVVDVGVGNGRPVRGLLDHLISCGKEVKYIGIDFSPDMLNVVEKNIKSWFGGKLSFEAHQLDIAHQRFANLLSRDYLASERDTINLILLLGATPTNLRTPSDAFRTVCESMNPDDLMIYTDFVRPVSIVPEWLEHSYSVRPRKPEILERHKLVLNQIGIGEELYAAEVGFDSQTNRNYSRARLKFALNVRFALSGGERIVTFEKGDAITLWHCWQSEPREIMDMFVATGYQVVHTSQSQDHNYILAIAEVKRS